MLKVTEKDTFRVFTKQEIAEKEANKNKQTSSAYYLIDNREKK